MAASSSGIRRGLGSSIRSRPSSPAPSDGVRASRDSLDHSLLFSDSASPAGLVIGRSSSPLGHDGPRQQHLRKHSHDLALSNGGPSTPNSPRFLAPRPVPHSLSKSYRDGDSSGPSTPPFDNDAIAGGSSTPQVYASSTRTSILSPTPRRTAAHQAAEDANQFSVNNERSPLLRSDSLPDRTGTPMLQQEYLSGPHFYDETEQDATSSLPTFLSTERGTKPLRSPTLRSRVKLLWTQTVSNTISTCFLLFIVLWALASRSLNYLIAAALGRLRLRPSRSWDNPDRWKNEELVKDVKYYAKSCGYQIIDQEVVTEDGYKLRVHKVIAPSHANKLHADGKGGFPVIIQHGLFQTSGSFVTSEERSLAFWLAEQGGYQVYLGNNRAVFDMGHVTLKRSDPRFWDYNIKELAMYDLPALVDHVCRDTGYDKVAFIGHSQGNATMFVSLARGIMPQLGDRLSVFIALAPAVFAGPLTTGFPFTVIKHMDWKKWRRIFGTLDFIPIMRWSYDWTPGLPFALLGYQMFAFLFQWTDANWLLRRKPKMFRFTPSPVPSAGIFWWTGLNGFSSRGCVLNQDVSRWFDKRFPPLALYHGGKDYLVMCEPLLQRLSRNEPDVKVIRVQRLPEGEHCDGFWSLDAVEETFVHILDDIERTRPPYPHEVGKTDD